MVSNPPSLLVPQLRRHTITAPRLGQPCEPVSDFIALPALPRPKVARHRAASRPCAGRPTSLRRGAARSGLRHGDPRNEPGARVASPTTPCRKKARGTDGVMAKRLDAPYRAGERTMIKVKHERTADCVIAGFRWHKKGAGTMIGSLLLGLYDDDHTLHHVGVAAAFTATVRKQLVVELTPLRADALEDHPWRDWAVAQEEASAKGQRLPGATSRWNRGKDLSWEPLRPERVCEVAYDHMQGTRFRHAA